MLELGDSPENVEEEVLKARLDVDEIISVKLTGDVNGLTVRHQKLNILCKIQSLCNFVAWSFIPVIGTKVVGKTH